MGFSGEYRIYLYRSDESLSCTMVLHARADMDAKGEAERLLKNGLVRAEIWRDEVRVGAIDLRNGRPGGSDADMWVPEQWRVSFE